MQKKWPAKTALHSAEGRNSDDTGTDGSAFNVSGVLNSSTDKPDIDFGRHAVGIHPKCKSS